MSSRYHSHIADAVTTRPHTCETQYQFFKPSQYIALSYESSETTIACNRMHDILYIVILKNTAYKLLVLKKNVVNNFKKIGIQRHLFVNNVTSSQQ